MYAKAGRGSRGYVSLVPFPFSFDIALLLQLVNPFAVCVISQSTITQYAMHRVILTLSLRPK
jgi:hypothetical protein